jgi:hypothetical protein
MTAEAIDLANLTPVQMNRLCTDLQSTGMMLTQAAEAADILARIVGGLPGMEGKLDRMLADTADMRATLTRIEARMAAAAEGRARNAETSHE